MEALNDLFKNKKNLINFIFIILLVTGLGIGIYLVRQQQILRGRALGSPPIEFIGPVNALTTLSGGKIGLKVTQGQSATVELRLTSPFGAPGSGGSNPTITQSPTNAPAPTTVNTPTSTTRPTPTTTSPTPTSTVGSPAGWLSPDGVTINYSQSTVSCQISIAGSPTQLRVGQTYNFTVTETPPRTCTAGTTTSNPPELGSCSWDVARKTTRGFTIEYYESGWLGFIGSSSTSVSWKPLASGVFMMGFNHFSDTVPYYGTGCILDVPVI